MSQEKLIKEGFEGQEVKELNEEAKKTLRELALADESLWLARYVKASVEHFMEDGIDKTTYIMGSSLCLETLISKLDDLTTSICQGSIDLS